MIAGIVFLISLMLLVTQLMIQGSSGEWPSITIASELGLPAEHVYFNWMVFDRTLRFIVNEVQLWIILLFAAALIYWLTDFTDEMLGRLAGKRAAPALTHSPSGLADGQSS